MNPAEKREDRHEELYAAVLEHLGLQTPQGPSQAHPGGIEGSPATDVEHPADCTCGWRTAHLPEVTRRDWPTDY